ncbi:sigma-70 family RNA polymerase sigma factor [Anaerovoracaceae bacterium 42-11]
MNTQERNNLVNENLGLVKMTINKYAGEYLNANPLLTWDDLFQEGVTGLIKAAEHFDSAQGAAFSTYAVRAITNHIYKYVQKNIPSYKNDNKENEYVTVLSYEKVLADSKEGHYNDTSLSRSYVQEFRAEDIDALISSMQRIQKKHERSEAYKLGIEIKKLQFAGFRRKDILKKLGLSARQYDIANTVTTTLNKEHRNEFSWVCNS